ncbi:hypothetical protein [Rhodococcus sp. NJ-530]|nr:hypothetical protein [Rhodococcus sp. NJ-530]
MWADDQQITEAEYLDATFDDLFEPSLGLDYSGWHAQDIGSVNTP